MFSGRIITPGDSQREMEQAEKIIRLDVLCIAANIVAILHDGERGKAFTEQQGPDAQTILNLLQVVMYHPFTQLPIKRIMVCSSS